MDKEITEDVHFQSDSKRKHLAIFDHYRTVCGKCNCDDELTFGQKELVTCKDCVRLLEAENKNK